MGAGGTTSGDLAAVDPNFVGPPSPWTSSLPGNVGANPNFVGPPAPQQQGFFGTVGSGIMKALNNPQTNRYLQTVGSSLLAQSGWHTQPVTLSEMLGKSMLAGQQDADQQAAYSVQKQAADIQMREAIGRINQGSEGANFQKPDGTVFSARRGTPQYDAAISEGLPITGVVDAQHEQPGFELSPGQTRFDSKGQTIASLPATPATPPTGGFELSPGQTRFDASGKSVASLPPASPQQNVDPESVENTANMIANGQMPMLSGYSLRSPWGQAVVNRVAEINPDFQSQSNGVLTAFMKGPESRTVRALNVSIAHLDTLSDLAKALDNKDARVLNSVRNEWRKQTGSELPAEFDAAKLVVANEVVKAITATGGTLEDRRAISDEVDKASSPKQLQGVIGTFQQLLAGQMGGLEQQYQVGTQRTDFRDKFLQPETRKVLDKLSPAVIADAAPAAPAPQITATNPVTGERMVFDGEKWQPLPSQPQN